MQRLLEQRDGADHLEEHPDRLFPWLCVETGTHRGGGGAGGGGAGGGGAGDEEEGTTKKKNKTKYTCPSCLTNIWGKPDLVVLCGPCGEVFAMAI